MMVAQQPIDEAGNGVERELRRLALWHVANAGKDRGLDRAGALFLDDLDLPQRAVLIVLALHDEDRDADVIECFRDIPFFEIRVRPRLVPRAEGAIDIGMPRLEPFA